MQTARRLPYRLKYRILIALSMLLAMIFFYLFSFKSEANPWTKLAPGIEYQDLNDHALSQWSHVHVFRIDLTHNELNLIMARSFADHRAFISEFAEHTHALIALNGGFFDQHYQPLGLRINKQYQHNPLKYISWWGVFYIQNNRPHLTNVRHLPPQHQQVDFAIQSGPRLLIHGQIPSLKPGFAERSALGITSTNKIIILVTENNPVTTTWLAEHMKAKPINCVDAINLDGGSSSQLYAQIGPFKINAPSFARVSDAIIVKSK